MRRKHGIHLLMILLSLLILTAATAVITSAATTKVTTANVNLRKSASSSSKVKVTVPKGKYVNAVGTKGKWTKVVYFKSSGKSYTGYIFSKYLSSPSSESGTTAEVATSIWIRSGPSVSYRRIGVINAGNSCVITGTSGTWYKVRYKGISGYIKQGYLKEKTGNRQVRTAIYVRTSPSGSARAIAVVPANGTVYVRSKVNGKNWYLVSYNGRTGYMYGGYFKY
jgi:N-acetylmuramoyl-L-alanine amidase